MPNYLLKPIKGKKTFTVLFFSGKRFYESDASSVIGFGPAEGSSTEPVSGPELSAVTPVLYYAVVVRKKTAKKAVMRNRIKRLMRQSLRIVVAEHEASGTPVSFTSIILFWNRAPAHPGLIRLDDVLFPVRKMFERAAQYKSKKDSVKKQETDNYEKNNNPAD